MLLALAAFGGMLAQWRNGRSQRKKNLAEAIQAEAETKESEADTEVKLLPAYQAEVKHLREELKIATDKIDLLNTRLDEMGAALRVKNRTEAEWRAIAEKYHEQLKLHDIRPIVQMPDYVG